MDSLSQQVVQIIVASVFLLTVAIGVLVLVFSYQKRQMMNRREKEQLKANFEKEMLESRLEIQEQTLKNISQEIHDNIGQVLSLAKLTINTIVTSDPEQAKEKINSSRDLLTKAIKDLRHLSKSLNTDYLTDAGLHESVEHEVETIRHTGTFAIRIHTEGRPFRLEQKQELIIFRIFQESLQNVIKHAEADAIDVTFVYTDPLFVLRIADNGKGFAAGSSDDKKGAGLGLRNMASRARLIGASFTVESAPGSGTTVQIRLPL